MVEDWEVGRGVRERERQSDFRRVEMTERTRRKRKRGGAAAGPRFLRENVRKMEAKKAKIHHNSPRESVKERKQTMAKNNRLNVSLLTGTNNHETEMRSLKKFAVVAWARRLK